MLDGETVPPTIFLSKHPSAPVLSPWKPARPPPVLVLALVPCHPSWIMLHNRVELRPRQLRRPE